ncbi:STAS domain-containing protein [Paucisalibacillus globulus]|uniref:STAS domain-containing protein n=1 Tax=Paucisalibacillus globulus TaxID=351095 RepID=UPI000414FF04|nr:STAS domain-containing protein [Paucisalibacillus globulus]
MNTLDKQLHDYLMGKISSITEEWLETRTIEAGSIYSADTKQKVEQMLRAQNTLTNKTVISALLNKKHTLEQYVEEWVHIVSESRVKSDTPTFEVIHALNNAKDIFFKRVVSFIMENDAHISKANIIRWHTKFSKVFNTITTRFSEMHYTLMNQRLSSQQELIDELSTPIIPISDKVAILPLQGNVDTTRMKQIYETLPEKVVDSQVEYLFIDLSGIPIMDIFVANELWQVISLLKVLGITTAISGVQVEVAHSLNHNQNNFKEVPTFSTLKQAIKMMDIADSILK